MKKKQKEFYDNPTIKGVFEPLFWKLQRFTLSKEKKEQMYKEFMARINRKEGEKNDG